MKSKRENHHQDAIILLGRPCLKLQQSIQIKRVRLKCDINAGEVLMSLFFFFGSVGAKCVSDIVGHPIEPSVEAIDQALDGNLAEHEDNDNRYRLHKFIEDQED